MRHCPKCLTLFSNHSTECPDCRVGLADGAPPERRDRKVEDDLEVVFQCEEFTAADQVAAALNSNGIRAAVNEHYPIQWLPYLRFGGDYPYVVYVLAHDAERARALICDFLQSKPVEPLGDE
jgi:hypothetical protein